MNSLCPTIRVIVSWSPSVEGGCISMGDVVVEHSKLELRKPCLVSLGLISILRCILNVSFHFRLICYSRGFILHYHAMSPSLSGFQYWWWCTEKRKAKLPILPGGYFLLRVTAEGQNHLLGSILNIKSWHWRLWQNNQTYKNQQKNINLPWKFGYFIVKKC